MMFCSQHSAHAAENEPWKNMLSRAAARRVLVAENGGWENREDTTDKNERLSH